MFRKWNAAINLKTRTKKMEEIIVEVDEVGVGFRLLHVFHIIYTHVDSVIN
jgi:hypothetical protein